MSSAAGFDPILLSQVRLGVISVLMTRESATFPDLRAVLGLTQGNLGAHLRKLEKAGYVEIIKEFVDRKPRTTTRWRPDTARRRPQPDEPPARQRTHRLRRLSPFRRAGTPWLKP